MNFIEIFKKIEELIASCKIIGNPASEKILNMWHDCVQFVKDVGEKSMTTSDHFLLYEEKVSKLIKIFLHFLEREQYLLQEFGQTLTLNDRIIEDTDSDIEEEPESPMVGDKRKGHHVWDTYQNKK